MCLRILIAGLSFLLGILPMFFFAFPLCFRFCFLFSLKLFQLFEIHIFTIRCFQCSNFSFVDEEMARRFSKPGADVNTKMRMRKHAIFFKKKFV